MLFRSDSGLFRTRAELESQGYTLEANRFKKGAERYLPLYEAKMIHHYDHRWATFDGADSRDATEAEKADPSFEVLPRYWVSQAEVSSRLQGRWDREWLMGWRDICRSTDERTVISSIIPLVGSGDTLLLMLPKAKEPWLISASLNTFSLDFLGRQKIGGTHLKYHVFKQLPILPPAAYAAPCPWEPSVGTIADWIKPRVLELVYTSHSLASFARDLGYDGPPFAWDPERRFALRCELDAAFFHLYGIARDDADYIMETFPIVKRKDLDAHGEYRTKRVILERYDEYAAATARNGGVMINFKEKHHG